MPDPTHKSEQPLAFGAFQLFREQKILLEDLRPVRIGSRALELLIALAERAGEIVGKNELIACVWPDTVVEENNLRVHIAALRKLLGDGQDETRFILNVAGRGYSFVAPVTRLSAPEAGGQLHAPPSTLPAALTRVLGRDQVIQTVLSLLAKRRLITIVGPAGMGKTTVGLAVADRVTGDLRRKVCFADLATIADPQLVAAVIAAATGVVSSTDDALGMLVASLRDANLLLLLDNCEHVIAPVAEVVEKLLRGAPGVTIIATSRERLAADGEHVVSLGPLECPLASPQISAANALRFPAVELFVERAVNALDSFRISDANAATIVEICRRLDGIPLAVELVAARAGTLGLEVLSRSLDQNLLVLSKGKRTASERHQSLSSTLEWSYRLLGETEQAVLRRVAAFNATFSTEAATAVVAEGEVGTDAVRAALIVLTQRSLLVTEVGGSEVRYRLLYVTRMFALARLAERDEETGIRRRHAVYHQRMLQSDAGDWDTLDRNTWLQRHGADLDDLRAALHWCFAPGGDLALGAAIFVGSLPFGVQLSLKEFGRRAQLTLDSLREQGGNETLAELRVHTSLAAQMMNLGDDAAMQQRIESMRTLSARLGMAKLMTEPLAGRAVLAMENVDFAEALRQVEALQEITRGADDAFAVLVADRVSAQVFHWAGDQVRARARAERVLRHPAPAVPLIYGTSPVDRRVSMRIVLARIAWLEGRADEARSIAAESFGIAQTDSPSAICQTLAFASCPVALWSGDLVDARVSIEALLECGQRYNFMRWYRLALCYQHALESRVGTGASAGSSSQPLAPATPVSLLHRDLLTTVDPRWFDIDTSARAMVGRAGWCTAELLRVAGDRALRDSHSGAAAAAEVRYLEALQAAREQGALAWELRAATSLASLRIGMGHPDDAIEALESLCGRFPEGQHTADLRAARQLVVTSRVDASGVH